MEEGLGRWEMMICNGLVGLEVLDVYGGGRSSSETAEGGPRAGLDTVRGGVGGGRGRGRGGVEGCFEVICNGLWK